MWYFPQLDLLLHEESVDRLLPPHELDDQSVQVDKQSPAETAGNTAVKHKNTEQDELEVFFTSA